METVGEATWSHSREVAAAGRHARRLRRDQRRRPATPSSTRVFFLQLRVVGSTMGTRDELAALPGCCDVSGVRPSSTRCCRWSGPATASPRWPRATCSARWSSPAESEDVPQVAHRGAEARPSYPVAGHASYDAGARPDALMRRTGRWSITRRRGRRAGPARWRAARPAISNSGKVSHELLQPVGHPGEGDLLVARGASRAPRARGR